MFLNSTLSLPALSPVFPFQCLLQWSSTVLSLTLTRFAIYLLSVIFVIHELFLIRCSVYYFSSSPHAYFALIPACSPSGKSLNSLFILPWYPQRLSLQHRTALNIVRVKLITKTLIKISLCISILNKPLKLYIIGFYYIWINASRNNHV